MGVLSCALAGCDHIMCDALVANHYICSSCLEELRRVKDTWPESLSLDDLRNRIEAFLDTSVGSSTFIDRDALFDGLIEIRK
jgi:hypothetical protein